jgi:hypothetical protein
MTLILWPLTLEFNLLFKNFNLAHNFRLVSGRAFIFHMCIPSGETFHLIPWPWPSDLGVWPILKNSNFGHNFWLVGGRAFILQCIPSGKTFHLIPWPWGTGIWPCFRKIWPWLSTLAKHILWMCCFIEIFNETKETVPKCLAGPYLTWSVF